MKDLQTAHHEHHEAIREKQNVKLKVSEPVDNTC